MADAEHPDRALQSGPQGGGRCLDRLDRRRDVADAGNTESVEHLHVVDRSKRSLRVGLEGVVGLVGGEGEMHVEIDETRKQVLAGDIDHSGSGGHADGAAGPDGADPGTFDQNAGVRDWGGAGAVDQGGANQGHPRHGRLGGRPPKRQEHQCCRDQQPATHAFVLPFRIYPGASRRGYSESFP